MFHVPWHGRPEIAEDREAPFLVHLELPGYVDDSVAIHQFSGWRFEELLVFKGGED